MKVEDKSVIENNLALLGELLAQINYNLFYFDYGNEFTNKNNLQEIKEKITDLQNALDNWCANN